MKNFYSSPLLLAATIVTLLSSCKKDDSVIPSNNNTTNTAAANSTGAAVTGTGITYIGTTPTTGTGGSGTGTGGSGTGTGGSGTGTGGSGTGTGGSGTGGTVTDTQLPIAKITSPVYGAVLNKNKSYTMIGSVSDDVELYQIVVQIRQKNTNTYVINKTITLPAGTKNYAVLEDFITPNMSTQQYYIGSITAVDKTNKKSAATIELSIH